MHRKNSTYSTIRPVLFAAGCIAFTLLSSVSDCNPKEQAAMATSPEKEHPTDMNSTPATKSERIKTDIKGPQVEIKTKFGTMIAVLYDETPQHRDNFLKLVREGYYDGLLFHRCIRGFMAQGGDPNSRGAVAGTPLGSGGPGYTIEAEIKPNLFHKKGALSAARQGDQVNPQKRSSGSQFYVVQGKVQTDQTLTQIMTYRTSRNPSFSIPEDQLAVYRSIGGTPELDADYTVFGEVISGIEVLDQILAQPTAAGDRPLENIEMDLNVIE